MSIKSIIRTLIRSGKSSLNIDDPFLVQKFLFTGEKHLAVFDVGAYVGDITTAYAEIFPQATMYCFEPFPNSFKELCRLAKSRPIKPYQIALSNQKGKAKLLINTDRSCNSMFPRPTKGATRKLTEKRIRLIFTEVMFVAHYKGGCLFHEVSDFLSRYHYKLYNLYNLKRARNGQLRWGNAIFLNPQMQARIESYCS
jgi:FkbM family methyltransferase